MRNFILAMLVVACTAFVANEAIAAPSTDKVIDTIAKVMMLNKDQINAIKFTVKEPVCVGTIVAKTAAQDYALVGFIGALKVTKMDAIPGMPKMSGATCKAYNPLQQAFQVVDRVGDKLLGKAQADVLRGVLASQIAEGKSEIDAQIAAIPYVGTIIGNWNCACAAAFDTHSVVEDFLNDQVRVTVSVVQKFRAGDVGSAVSEMITGFGPEAGCKLGAELTVGGIPVVSDIAAEACSSVLGAAVDWAVTAVGDGAEALGLVGGQHIPPDQYYQQMFALHVGAPNYVSWGTNTLYPKCYDYFAKSNMANSTAKKVCAQLLDRYNKESIGNQEWARFQDERSLYTNNALKPLAEQSVHVSDADFLKVKTQAHTECNSYFAGQYPHIKDYITDPKKGGPENYCDYTTLNKFSGFQESVMDTMRKKAQQNLLYALMNKLQPSCDVTKDRNVLKCAMGEPFNQCKIQMGNAAACKKSLTSGGMEVPCCQQGEPDFGVQQAAVDYATNLAKDIGEPFCFNNAAEPYKIRCTIQSLFQTCQKKFSFAENKDCKNQKKDAFGKVTDVCCSYEPEKLETIAGVKEAKAAVAKMNSGLAKDEAPNCKLGGAIVAISADPRAVSCGEQAMGACQKSLGTAACSKLGSGYVKSTCCELDAFATKTEELPYDPAARSDGDKALVKGVINKSAGNCYHGKTSDGKEDTFKVTCTTQAATKQCIKDMGRFALVSCDAKIANTGYVTSPCCMKDPAVLDLVGSAAKEMERKNTVQTPEDEKKKINPDVFKKDGGKNVATTAQPAGDKAAAGVRIDNRKPAAPKNVEEKSQSKRKAAPSKIPGLVSIKIISAKNKDSSSVNPFSAADVVKKIDPKSAGTPVVPSFVAPSADTSFTAPPVVTPHIPPRADTIPSISNPNAPVTIPSVPAAVPSFCKLKPDGNYCGTGAKARTVYSCVNGAAVSSRECYGTCNNGNCSKD